MSNQLTAARYTYHRQIIKRYSDLVNAHIIPLEQAKEAYTEAMANYDGIIENAATGSQEANQADMDLGFNLK